MAASSLHTVDRVMQTVFLLAERHPLSARDVAAALELPLSTVYRYLASLKHSGMVWELPDARYALGPRCVQLETAFRAFFEQGGYHPIMRTLAEQTGETVALLVPAEGEAVCIDTIESPLPLRYTFSKGAAKPMLRGASAKAMLPYLPAAHVEELIDASTALDAGEKARLRAALPRIRARGYAVTVGEVDQGVWAVGVPVFKANGALEASLSIIAPLFRVEGVEQRLIGLAVQAARRMSNENGWEIDHAV